MVILLLAWEFKAGTVKLLGNHTYPARCTLPSWPIHGLGVGSLVRNMEHIASDGW
jgi:hypothetical protein